MSGRGNLASPADVVYIYDGSFDGFLCCVHESVYKHELPFEIWREDDAPITLLETKFIETDGEKADKVSASIPTKISMRAYELVSKVFLSCLKQKELKLLIFLLRGYREGGRLTESFGDPDIAPLISAEHHLSYEAHLLTGFIRFSDVGGALVSTITPKNFVLPLLTRHFHLRYRNESFLIFDKTNKAALIQQDGKIEIIQVDSIEFPEISEQEAKYQELWKRFYNTISIEARENPRCRMSHMPKRYWENMLEVRDLL